MIREVFNELINEGIVQIFVDDIIIPSVDYESGIRSLQRVLKAAATGGLTINWDKCQFLQTKVEYLGYEVDPFFPICLFTCAFFGCDVFFSILARIKTP